MYVNGRDTDFNIWTVLSSKITSSSDNSYRKERDEIKSFGKFAFLSLFKIGGRG